MSTAVFGHLDENERLAIQAEIGTELLPGTEIMTDVGRSHFVRSGGSSGKVLVPQPDNAKEDPLNWSPRWKFASVMMAALYTLIVPFSQLSIAPIFPVLEKEFDVGLTQVANFTGVSILVLGFSNFLWVPLAESFGRRFVFIASTLVSLGANIWHAVAPSYHSYLGSCVLDGLGSGPGETLMPMVIADVLFLHERGRYMTFYFMTYNASLQLSPVVIGAMTQNVGWRNFFWLNVAMRGALIVAALFFFPETRWGRGGNHKNENVANSKEGETNLGAVENMENVEDGKNRGSLTKARGNYVHIDNYYSIGTPAKKQFKLWQAANTTVVFGLIRDFWVPIKIFFFPIVCFGGMAFTTSASQYLFINLTQSQMLESPPYNFSGLQVGFTNFAAFIGAVIGLITAGPISDWISMRATIRNKGIREPEMRLPALIPYILIMVIGNVIIAVGVDRGWTWYPIVIVGFTFIGIQVCV